LNLLVHYYIYIGVMTLSTSGKLMYIDHSTT